MPSVFFWLKLFLMLEELDLESTLKVGGAIISLSFKKKKLYFLLLLELIQ